MTGEGQGTGFLPPSPTELRTREVEAEIAAVCGALNAAQARLVELTATALDEGLWSQWGIASPSHWLRWKAGVGVAQSQAMVRVARRLGELPETAAAFAQGRLSFDQVKVIVQYVPTHYEVAAAHMATQLMVPQLSSALRQYPFDPPPPAPSSEQGEAPDRPAPDEGGAASDRSAPDEGGAAPDRSAPDDRPDHGSTGDPTRPDQPQSDGPGDPSTADPTESSSDGSTPPVTDDPTQPTADGPSDRFATDEAASSEDLTAATNPDAGATPVPEGAAGSTAGAGSDGEEGRDAAPDADTDGPGRPSPPLAAEDPRVRPYLSFGFRDDGSWTISGRLLPEDGALVEQALNTIREVIWNERRAEAGTDGGPVEVTNIDCLLRLVDLAAANPSQPRPVRDRYRALLHLDADTLGDWEAGRRPELHLGPWLGRPIVERITCDTNVQTVLERHGHAVAFGPQHPNIPDRIRRLVERRDRSCRFPGCSHRRGIQLHHLTRRVDGGWTTEANLICLCRRHHTDHHRGHFTITGDPTRPDGLQFHTVDGTRIGGPVPPTSNPDPPTGTWDHPPGYRLDRRWFHLEPDPPPDLADTG